MMVKKFLAIGMILTMVLTLAVFLFELKEDYPAWMTYGNFDKPREKNFIYYLLPGTRDNSHALKYSFDKIHWPGLLAVFLVLFPLLGFLRLWQRGMVRKNRNSIFRVNLKRGITQLFCFIVARLGILRVSGVCPVKRSALGIFPFLNCQSCELATGGCPLGMLQMALLKGSVPFFTVSVLAGSGFFFGRFVCGWFCPFGFLSEILDRFSGHLSLPSWIHRLKFISLGFFVVLLIVLILNPGLTYLPFCAFACPAAFFYGILPFSVTNGLVPFVELLPRVHLAMVYHLAFALGFLYLAKRYSGWIFCIALCPLGAFFSLFNRMAFLRIVFDKSKCTDCGMCRKSCPTQHNPIKSDFLSKSACIACGTCTRVCPKGSLNFSVQLMGKAESVRKRVRGVNGQKFAHRAGNEQIFPLSAEKPTVQLIQK